jgi:hypothetical protein
LAEQDAVHVTDGKTVFQVPKEHALAIIKAVPGLRYSFENFRGRHIGYATEE